MHWTRRASPRRARRNSAVRPGANSVLAFWFGMPATSPHAIDGCGRRDHSRARLQGETPWRRAPGRRRLRRASRSTHTFTQVLTAIILGVLLGHFYPQLGEQMKPLGDGFIKLIKMLIAPIIFCTVVHGIASMEDMKKVGRVGLKALIYFEVVTTLALIVGLLVINILQPGSGMNVDAGAIDTKSI